MSASPFLLLGFIFAYMRRSSIYYRSHIYYHISQREARKQPDLWTDFRPNKHALRVWGWLRHSRNSQVTGCEMDRSRRHLSREDRFSSSWRSALVIAKEGKMCEHRSINRHWWAGKINSIPPRAGFRNLSAAFWASKKFWLIILYANKINRKNNKLEIKDLITLKI